MKGDAAPSAPSPLHALVPVRRRRLPTSSAALVSRTPGLSAPLPARPSGWSFAAVREAPARHPAPVQQQIASQAGIPRPLPPRHVPALNSRGSSGKGGVREGLATALPDALYFFSHASCRGIPCGHPRARTGATHCRSPTRLTLPMQRPPPHPPAHRHTHTMKLAGVAGDRTLGRREEERGGEGIAKVRVPWAPPTATHRGGGSRVAWDSRLNGEGVLPPSPPAAKLQLPPPAAFAARESAPTRRVRLGLSKGGGEASSERAVAAVATPAATPVAESW